MDKISIVIPIYNAASYLRQCLDSVINQSYANLEILLIDDGALDESGQICDEYALKDSRIKVIHKKNQGVAKARNDGLERCTGKYIYVMDADDYLELQALEVMHQEAKKTDADIVLIDYYTFETEEVKKRVHLFEKNFVTEDRKMIEKIQEYMLNPAYCTFDTKQYCGIGIVPPWTTLIKRDLIMDHKLRFDSDVRGVFEDGLFSLNIFECAKKVAYVKEPVYDYRMVQGSSTRRFRSDRLQMNDIVFHKIEEFGLNHQKPDSFYIAYYGRIMTYFFHLFAIFFFHKENKDGFFETYKLFKHVILSEPYRMALKCVDTRGMNRKKKVVINLLRWKCFFLVYTLLKIAY